MRTYCITGFQSTRPIRGATKQAVCVGRVCQISIHAPHTGRDHAVGFAGGLVFISIHAPHTGRDVFASFSNTIFPPFQSTRPIRGATKPFYNTLVHIFISIHAPHTGRDPGIAGRNRDINDFNPRAPYGARPGKTLVLILMIAFQSTRPIRGATLTRNGMGFSRIFQSTRPIRGATITKYQEEAKT